MLTLLISIDSFQSLVYAKNNVTTQVCARACNTWIHPERKTVLCGKGIQRILDRLAR